MKKPLLLCFYLSLCTPLITSCGFHLRGYQQPVLQNQRIVIKVPNTNKIHDQTSRNLEKHLTSQLLVLGAVVDSNYSARNQLNRKNNPTSTAHTVHVQIDNIELKKHRLVGTLTEVQLHMTAKLALNAASHQVAIMPLQLQRSYQYTQATVNTENQQEGRIIELMHVAMADKIAQQIIRYTRHSASVLHATSQVSP